MATSGTEPKKKLLFKVLVVGAPGTGKSCLLKRVTLNTFSDQYTPTIGVEFCGKVVKIKDTDIHLQFWDIGGSVPYPERGIYYKEAAFVLIVFDVQRQKTLEDAEKWIIDIKKKLKINNGITELPMVLLANKIDLMPEKKIDLKIMNYLCYKAGIYGCLVTSAKENKGINEFAHSIANILSISSEKAGNDSKNTPKYHIKRISAQSPPSTTATTKQQPEITLPTKESKIEEVCNWLDSIGLFSLCHVFSINQIDGSVLFELSDSDLQAMGITALGPRKKLISELNKLKSTNSNSQTSTSNSVIQTLTKSGNRFGSQTNEPLKYKGVLEFPEGYIPQGTCSEVIVANENVLKIKIPKLKFIVSDCEKACSSCMNDPTVQQIVIQLKLDRNEVYSILIYTYDLGMQAQPSENFYFQVNEILRTRQAIDLEAIKGYLYYVLSGLRKLPSIEAVVYRGNSSTDLVKSEYVQGREIFWSGFTSTTTELERAKQFARPNGVVFRIKINNGKDISQFSVMGNEHEILLPPNSCLFVSNPIHVENDGIQYVDMIEKVGSFKW